MLRYSIDCCDPVVIGANFVQQTRNIVDLLSRFLNMRMSSLFIH